MSKYKTEERITTSDFYYDIIHGGYIKPGDILVDQERAKRLQDAADILGAWEQELYDDNMLNDL